MHRYVKGARSERELLHSFYDRGWSVIRSGGSGVNSLSPDLVVLKDREALCIECKAWERSSLSIDPEQFAMLAEWESKTSFQTFVAWRMNGRGWYFVKLGEFKRNEKAYSVTMKRAIEINRRLDIVAGAAPAAAVAQSAAGTLSPDRTVPEAL